MALFSPIMGIGQFYGNITLRGNTTYVEDTEILSPTGIEIQFYSPSDEYVGMVGTTFDNANLINLRATQEKNGDLKKFEFSITRNVDIPFYTLMECRAFIDGEFWFSGELQLKPNEDRRDPEFVYEGRGWSSYLKEIKINKLYQNKTLDYILKDIIENDISTVTPIQYNPDLIIPPNYTVVKLEFKKKTAEKAIKEVLKIANVDYKTSQYRYGVDKNKQFFFNIMQDDIITGFFEGHQYQDPDVKENLKAVVNQIDIYRAQENSQDVEFVSRVEDTESQGLYDIRNRDLTISDYVDTTTAERIASAIIDQFKEPVVEMKIKSLNTKEEPYDMNYNYFINNKKDNYTTAINEFEDTSIWDLTNAANTSITTTQDKVLSGKKAFKVVTGALSPGEYIEYTLEKTFNFPTSLRIFIAQDEPGELFAVEMEDEDGNVISVDSSYILAEDGTFILNEENGLIESEVSAVDIKLKVDYQAQTFDISSLQNIKKFRIYFNTEEIHTIYFDRFDILSNTYKQTQLTINKIIYRQQGNTILSEVIFGEEIDNIIKDIKKLDDKQINTVNIFQKS